MDITDFYPVENYASFDKPRTLKWNNETILKAIEYYRLVTGESITFDKLIEKVIEQDTSIITALVYGGLCSANKNINLNVFSRIFKSEFIHEYIQCVGEGLKSFFPSTDDEVGEEKLDESYPDTQKEVKKKKI